MSVLVEVVIILAAAIAAYIFVPLTSRLRSHLPQVWWRSWHLLISH
jgi:hypothetical protein